MTSSRRERWHGAPVLAREIVRELGEVPMRIHADQSERAFRRATHAVRLVGLLTAGCVGLPDPPPMAEDLSELNRKYEHPTAEIPDELVQQLIAAARETLGPEALLTGFDFTRNHISETSIGLAEHANVEELDLQGRVRTRFDCPGDDTPDAVAAGPGQVSALFGVTRSRLRRGFTGRVENCRFPIATTFGGTEHVVLSGDFSADLGADLELGHTLPGTLLIHLVNPKGSSTGTLGTIDLTRDEYAFRLTDTGALELLVEAIDLGPANLGSLVVVLTADGFLGLRESRGQWNCGTESEPCALVR